MNSQILSISPASHSPVLKGVMTISGSGFGVDKSVLKVNLVNGTEILYEMRILSVSDTELKCGIPGGLAGNYEVKVTKAGEGYITPITP